MSLDFLTLSIKCQVKNGKFEVKSNLNPEGIKEVVGNFLREQIGAGKDRSKPNEKDTYQIVLRWHPENDRIVSGYDTGNKALRDSILIEYLKTLD